MGSSPYIELLIRYLYWNNIDLFLRFKKIKRGNIEFVNFSKVSNYLMDIGISSGDLLLVHSSYGNLKCTQKSPIEIIEELKDIVGENGSVTVVDPSSEVIAHLANSLRGYPTITCHVLNDSLSREIGPLNRVLVTGQIEELPDWLSTEIIEGGFAIAPIGKRDSQNLLKLEKQGDEFYDTDLGPVLFGPVDIADSIIDTPSPEEIFHKFSQSRYEALDARGR